MERYGRIHSVTFGQLELPLPVSLRLARSAAVKAAGSDNDAFATSVQLQRPLISLELTIRDTASAEQMQLGQADVLCVSLLPTRSGQAGRTITIDQAVLAGIELLYAQDALAQSKLTFVAEAQDGLTDPFESQEVQP